MVREHRLLPRSPAYGSTCNDLHPGDNTYTNGVACTNS